MRQIAEKIEELVGRTPLLEVKRIEEAEGLKARLLVKLELFNPAGSVKDRTALFMIRDGEEKGLLKPGSVIIEPTSGNTGIGLAAIGGARGYRVIFTMPETMSVERQKLLKGYGAEIYRPGDLGRYRGRSGHLRGGSRNRRDHHRNREVPAGEKARDSDRGSRTKGLLRIVRRRARTSRPAGHRSRICSQYPGYGDL